MAIPQVIVVGIAQFVEAAADRPDRLDSYLRAKVIDSGNALPLSRSANTF